MVSTANMIELLKIAQSTHSDPHHVLGMHIIGSKEKKHVAVRAFLPQAKSVAVVDAANPDCSVNMKRIHADGFFEAIFNDRSEVFKYFLRIEDYENQIWDTYDAYSFLPAISEMDLYLFGKATHYRIFEKLGAHVINIDGVDGVHFGVWAPNAKRVSVVGDFNQWDGRRNPMRTLSNSGVWELFVPGLAEGDLYKFEIKGLDDKVITKSDPYAYLSELRPQTASVVCDINKYEWNDEAWENQRGERNAKSSPINIYEVHIGSWRRNENGEFLSYREFAEEIIAYVKDMGYTHIQLLPVEEHPFDGSWGYQVTGYYAPTSRYGSPEDFMYFVDQCHQNGIGVLLDWVPAHFPKDAHGLAKFDGTALYEHEDPKRGEHPDWGTLIFNYGRKEVVNFLICNALFWLDKYHIDGLRVDAVASMLYLDYGKKDGEWVPNQYGGKENLDAVEFLKHMNSIVEERYPNRLMIAEESTAWPMVSRSSDDGGLGFTLKWNMGWMNDFLRYMSKECVYRQYHHNDITFSMVYAYTENFILVLSHDEVVHGKKSLLDKMPGDYWQKFANLRVAYGFMYGHPGKKLLFMGGELGQFKEWNYQTALDWFLLEYPQHAKLHNYVRDLNRLYLDNRAMWFDDFCGNGFEWIDSGDYQRSIVSFVRKTDKPDETLLFVCNFTPVPLLDHRIGVPYNCSYQEILNSDDEKYGGSGIINYDEIQAERIECNGRPYSIPIRVSPLGASVLKIT